MEKWIAAAQSPAGRGEAQTKNLFYESFPEMNWQ
jgi:hypothetical protein